MTTVTRRPAQAAAAGGQGRPPASPPPSTSSSKPGAPEQAAPVDASSRARSGRGTTTHPCAQKRAGCVHRGCSGHNRAGAACGNGRGKGTDHVGFGNCKNHGGSGPQGRKSGEREKIVATLEMLAIPAEGDPLEVLQAAVEGAHGVLLASRELVRAGATDVTLKLYLEGIERAARVAKSAAEAINLDELVRIREREADLLEQALLRALERSGMGVGKRAAFLGVFREELRAALPAGDELS